jgi:hypothetical protein
VIEVRSWFAAGRSRPSVGIAYLELTITYVA